MSYPDLINNGWFPSGIPWAEHVGQHADHGARGTFDYMGGVSSSLQLQVNWEDINLALYDLIGITSVNRDTLRLHRTVPMQHPIWPWMYCIKIAEVSPLKFTGKRVASGQFMGNTVCANYDRWIITAGFTTPKYRPLDDTTLLNMFGDPPQEWRRWTEWDEVPASMTQTRDRSTVWWAEGPKAGSTVQSDVGQRLTTRSVTLIWRSVPRFGLYVQGGDDLNSNLVSCIGCVNNAAFLGRAAGTLLCTGVRTIPISSPLPQALQDNRGDGLDPNVFYDVHFSMEWFQPPTDGATVGWNTAPNPNDPNGYWYKVVTSEGGTTGLVPTADFTQMFKFSIS